MMLIGRIFKEGHAWAAFCEAIGAYTQGPSRKLAKANLVECIELKCERLGLAISVTETGEHVPNGFVVAVTASHPRLLAAEVLRYQRERHGLSLAAVAKRLGVTSRSSYANYEQGRSDPSLTKFGEMLAAVAPELALTVAPIAPSGSGASRGRADRSRSRRS